MKMKKLKSYFLLPVSLTILLLMSCDEKLINSSVNQELAESTKEVAIEINQEKENYQFIESVYDENNDEFLLGEMVQSMPQKARAMRVGATEGGDTIRSADEIPVYTCEEINQKIYVDGSYRYLNLNITPLDSNAFNDLNVYKQPVEEMVAKTLIKDGKAYIYNANGELLQTEDAGSFNYSAILDSIKSAIAAENKGGSSPQGVKALQARRLTKAIEGARVAGMRMVSQTGDEIIMEMNLGASSESSLPQRVKSSVQKKAVMRFSGDMTRMIEQKIYENSQLVQLVTYNYQEDDQNFAKKAPASVRNLLPNSSVKAITIKSLKVKNDGSPYILVKKENYKKNQVTINL
jgi:hypothetical protein